MQRVHSRELIEICSAPEPQEAAWRELLVRFMPNIDAGVGTAFRQAGIELGREDREDLRQEVCCRLLQRERAALRQCRAGETAGIEAYLFRLAQRVAFDHLRRRRAQCRGGGYRVFSVGTGEVAERPPTPFESASPERAFLRGEPLRHILGRRPTASRRLDRQLLLWALRDGLSSREIQLRLGGRLGISAIDSRLYRLRRRLSRRGVDVPLRRRARS